MSVFSSLTKRETDGRPAVSVLVPIYNVQDYLEKCLTELCAQTLTNIEIIALDDGSTDGSPQILARFAAADSRVRVVTKANSGYGATINRGISEARGEYVGIAEPDDFVERTMYEKLYRVARRRNADLVKCDYFEMRGDESVPRGNLEGLPRHGVLDPVDKPEMTCIVPSIWAALYRRSMLEGQGSGATRSARREGVGGGLAPVGRKTPALGSASGRAAGADAGTGFPPIRCRETPGAAFQDTSFTMKAFYAARRVAFVHEPLVHYRLDNAGASSQSTDKLHFVAEEFAEARRFLAADPVRYRQLVGWLYRKYWDTAAWDYRRLAPECRPECVARLASDLREAARVGDLNLDLFPPDILERIAELLESDPAAFVAAHPEGYF